MLDGSMTFGCLVYKDPFLHYEVSHNIISSYDLLWTHENLCDPNYLTIHYLPAVFAQHFHSGRINNTDTPVSIWITLALRTARNLCNIIGKMLSTPECVGELWEQNLPLQKVQSQTIICKHNTTKDIPFADLSTTGLERSLWTYLSRFFLETSSYHNHF